MLCVRVFENLVNNKILVEQEAVQDRQIHECHNNNNQL